mmetsp:Transcript_30935/g.78134  ORF Transcript_30935/g.78134 Transcript_30935/m.78134 type:complete len:273 (+) Transcript_30935:1099-1917(+)
MARGLRRSGSPAASSAKAAVLSSRLAVPSGMPRSRPYAPASTTARCTSAGAAAGWRSRCRAAAAATRGAACEVPDSVLVAVLFALCAARTSAPGANRSTQGPVLVSSNRLSLRSVAPTVMAPRTREGLCSHASPRRLPAELTTVMPSSSRLCTARSRLGEPRLSSDSSTTAGRLASARTALMPATTALTTPLPAQSSTRTGTIRTSLAAPKRSPPMSEATCVPWPSQSAPWASVLGKEAGSRASMAAATRLPGRPSACRKSSCQARTPVSST